VLDKGLRVSESKIFNISRRQFVAGSAAVAALAPTGAFGRSAEAAPRRLKFRNLHTGEKLDTVYYADGRYFNEPLADISWILRDWRTDEQVEMDRDLIDLLYTLHNLMDSSRPFGIISGYRSPRTNNMLANRNGGVARKSLHMRAMAADINLPGRDLKKLYRAVRSLKLGGAGMYTKSGFVHVDTGRVRYW
jgi:uncharacterized protein YcbK (DUF882 family)